jgi:hypothetical protein
LALFVKNFQPKIVAVAIATSCSSFSELILSHDTVELDESEDEEDELDSDDDDIEDVSDMIIVFVHRPDCSDDLLFTMMKDTLVVKCFED